jgi:hypothetical protein
MDDAFRRGDNIQPPERTTQTTVAIWLRLSGSD